MAAVFYGPFARTSDWYQGLRDGRAVVPDPGRGVPTTGHRETLIRRAQDGFEHERLRWESARAAAMATLAGARARREHAGAALQRAEQALAEIPEEPEPTELRRRRYGEGGRNTALIALRRGREHDRRRRAGTAAVAMAEMDVQAATERVLALEDAVDREIVAARARVRRIQEHTHRRLAAYRRRLVRSHPYGGWVNATMDALDPAIPGWATRTLAGDLITDEGVSEPEPTPVAEPPVRVLPPEHRKLIELEQETTLFGSDRGQVHVHVPGPHVSPMHATLKRRGGGYRLRNKGSADPTYRNGTPVGWSVVEIGGTFDIGNFRYRLLEGARLEETRIGPCALVAYGLSAAYKGTPRLTNMSFSVEGNTLLAILGPSGAGKSSLFWALLTELKADGIGGRLFFRGLSLASHAAQLRPRLGFVPQKDHLFTTLTVQQMLLYVHRLRKPGHLPPGRRKKDIEDVATNLGLSRKLPEPISSLSGGQLKRVSVAMELLAEPDLLMLDEPTSGLDPGKDRDVMKLLKGISRTGERLVVVVTHATEHLDQADLVLVVGTQGRPVYFGRPGSLPEGLGDADYADLMTRLEDPVAEAEAYQAGAEAEKASREAEAAAVRAQSIVDGNGGRSRRPGPVGIFLDQFPVLVQRQVALLRTRASADSDASLARKVRRWAVVLMPALVAVFGGLLAAAVAPGHGLGPTEPTAPTAARTSLTLLVTLCMLGGQALTYSDLVAEYEMIRRERRAAIRTSSVVLAKWAVFAVIALVQAALVTGLFLLVRRPGPAAAVGLPEAWGLPWLGLLVSLAALSIAAMSLGLLISAVSAKLEQAVAIATAVAIAQVALSGGTSDLNRVLRYASCVLPSRWGFAAGASSVDLSSLSQPVPPPDALWDHTTTQWLTDLTWLGGLSVAFVVLAVQILERRLRKPQS